MCYSFVNGIKYKGYERITNLDNKNRVNEWNSNPYFN